MAMTRDEHCDGEYSGEVVQICLVDWGTEEAAFHQPYFFVSGSPASAFLRDGKRAAR